MFVPWMRSVKSSGSQDRSPAQNPERCAEIRRHCVRCRRCDLPLRRRAVQHHHVHEILRPPGRALVGNELVPSQIGDRAAVEHLFDGRGGRAPHPLENDLFAGVRLALNDEAGTDLVAAVIADAEGDGTAITVEASRRIGDDWKVELEARAWNGVEDDDQLAPLRRDDYVQLTLSRFF